MPLFSQQGYQAFRRTVKTTISLGISSTTVNEGNTVVFTVNTQNIRSGSQLAYTLSGINQSDLSQGTLTGTVTVVGSTVDFSITLSQDLSWQEGDETITVLIRRLGTAAPLELLAAQAVTVVDTSRAVTGQLAVETAGTYSDFLFTVPAGVTSISVLCVGAGGDGGNRRVVLYTMTSSRVVYYAGAGGGGGGLAWANNLAVTPGEVFTVRRNQTETSLRRGTGQFGTLECRATAGGSSIAPHTRGGARGAGTHGDQVRLGGLGGSALVNVGGGGGGGGAAGYGTGGGGGAGGTESAPAGLPGANNGGGGAGGSSGGSAARPGGAGGGVGLLGQGPTGQARAALPPLGMTGGIPGGGAGSAGTNGGFGDGVRGGTGGGGGGGGGGAGGGQAYNRPAGLGGRGAVRIIWPGQHRQFPSTSAQDLY